MEQKIELTDALNYCLVCGTDFHRGQHQIFYESDIRIQWCVICGSKTQCIDGAAPVISMSRVAFVLSRRGHSDISPFEDHKVDGFNDS